MGDKLWYFMVYLFTILHYYYTLTAVHWACMPVRADLGWRIVSPTVKRSPLDTVMLVTPNLQNCETFFL